MKYFTTDEEMEFLVGHLKSTDSVLEYGSGGSTVFLQDKVADIVSIEHDEDWYRQVDDSISNNVDYYLIPPNNPEWELQHDQFGRKNSKGDDGSFEDFAEYVTFPLSLGKKYDAIFIDGRARMSCAFASTLLLKPSGKIFIHDFGPDAPHPFLSHRVYYDPVDIWLKYHSHEDKMFCFEVK